MKTKTTFERKEAWRNNVMADTRLTTAQKLFALAVFSYAYGDKTECFPTYEHIAASMGQKYTRRLGDYGKALHEIGALSRSHIGTDDKQRPNYTYRINLGWKAERVSIEPPPQPEQPEAAAEPKQNPDTPGDKAKPKSTLTYRQAYEAAQAAGCHRQFSEICSDDAMRRDFDKILEEAREASESAEYDEWL